MPFVAFDVLAATAPHASRKPAAHADREGTTQFSDMLDKPDTTDQDTPKGDSKTQAAPAPAAATPAADSCEPASAATAKASVSPDIAATETPVVETDTAADKPATAQEIADFLAAVAAATGMKITPVAQPKTDEKPTETKTDDQDDDALAATDATAPVPAQIKSPDAAAIAVTVQPDATTATVTTETSAKTAGAEQAAATAVVAEDTAIPAGDAKDAKTQVAVKIETPALAPNLAPDAPAPKTDQQTLAPQAAQPAAQPQGQKPAAEAPAQAAKPSPAQHDLPAPDVAASTKPADNLQPLVMVQNHTAAAASADQASAALTSATAPQAVALPVAGIAIEIAGKAMAGKNRFEIRLDPPELGKIHVRLDVDHKGEVTSIITADRSDTFDLLRRDAQALERALQDAGVKTANNGLQFSLRDHGAGRHDQPALAESARVIVRDDNLDTDIIAPVYRSFTGNRAGVDIRV